MAEAKSAKSTTGAKNAKPANPANIRIGIGGWTYAPWRGNFYPADLTQSRELEYASQNLTSIEINGTFYGLQKPASYESGIRKPRTISSSR